MSKYDYQQETIDDLSDNARIRIYRAYHKIDAILTAMDKELAKASDYPEDLTRVDAIDVQSFLSEMDSVMRGYEALFNRFDE